MSTETQSIIAIFGATGAIGSALCKSYSNAGWRVLAIGRNREPKNKAVAEVEYFQWSVGVSNKQIPANFPKKIDAVVWAQGANTSDDIFSFERTTFDKLLNANVIFIIETLTALLDSSSLAKHSKMVVISSIWQDICRNKKLSYSVSKAALRGLVQSLAIDLSNEGYVINAVLPGILDTPMTHANLTPTQIQEILKHTPGGKMASLDSICEIVGFLTSMKNTGINGQFIPVDQSFSRSFIL